MKKEIDVFAYRVESFDSESFIADLTKQKPNSIILLFNRDGARFVYKPLLLTDDKNENWRFWRFNHPKVDYLLFPLWFIVDFFLIGSIFLRYSLKFNIKTILVENTYVAVAAGILRSFGLVKKMVYLPGDWLAGSREKSKIWNNFGNNIIFPLFDYLACKASDLTLNCTPVIIKSRNRFWGRPVSRHDLVFQNKLIIKQKIANTKNDKVVFLGTIRKDSGIELVLAAWSQIIKHDKISLKIIGEITTEKNRLEQMAKKYGITDPLCFTGFTKREEFSEVLSDCFCGLNLITSKDSYSNKTLPAKVCDYLQYLVPVVVTKNIGPMAKIIEINKLGMVIDPTKENVYKAILHVYKNQVQYRSNIVKYIHSLEKKESIVKYL